MDVPDSCDGNFYFFVVVSSCAIYALSKMALNLSVAALSDELKCVKDRKTDQPTDHCQVKIGLFRLSELEIGLS